jgi:hypothetical protein
LTHLTKVKKPAIKMPQATTWIQNYCVRRTRLNRHDPPGRCAANRRTAAVCPGISVLLHRRLRTTILKRRALSWLFMMDAA